MTNEEYRALQEEAHMLAELKRHPGWAYLEDFSNVRMRLTKTSILNGNAKDWETYIRESAWLRGIHDTLDAPDTVATILQNEINRRRENDEALS